MQETREHIKSRMLKNAARAWGIDETGAESNFDPLVSMLLTACSVELEKISGEIQASRARVLERLVQLLSPDALTGAFAAHAVVCATPVERAFEVPEGDQYYINRKRPMANENDEQLWKDIFFSPTASFRINRASIRFIASGNTLYRVNNGINKEPIAQTDPGKELPNCSLWLGIDEPTISLKDTLFFFDIRNEAQRQQFYHQLPKAIWYGGEQPISHLPGYGNRSISGEQLNFETALSGEDDICGKMKKSINAYYKKHFISLTDDQNQTASEDNILLSGMIAESFSGKNGKLLQQQPLRWICIDFPQTINSRVLEDVVCSMNCFPVFNRKLHKINYRLQDIVNVIPLQTEDIFLSLEEISNEEGKILNSREQTKQEDQSTSFLLRKGGVGRFDERDASSIVDYLLQLLRDESAAFSALGNDFMNNEMKQLQQIINKLEQRLFSQQLTREQIPYIIIRKNAKAQWQNVFIDFWSTCGAEANNIKAGNALRLYRGSTVRNNQVLLVTPTIGARDKLSTTESVFAYKSALLSKDRLITNEDIKAFCHFKLGEKVKKIEVKKGMMVHPDQQVGFLKTIDVEIEIKKKDYQEMKENGELHFWIDSLKLLLEEKSSALLPYRVILHQAA